MIVCKVLKLSNGDTIVGNVIEETRGYIEVLFPVKIHTERQGDSMGITFVKWDPTSNFKYPFRIFKTSVVSVSEPTLDFIDHYKEIYSTFDGEEDRINEVEIEDRKEEDLSEELDKIMQLMLNLSSNNKPILH